MHASDITLNNPTLFQDIYSNKLKLRRVDPFIMKLRELRKLNSNDETYLK